MRGAPPAEIARNLTVEFLRGLEERLKLAPGETARVLDCMNGGVPGVDVYAAGGNVAIQLRGAEIADSSCIEREPEWVPCYGDAETRLSPAEAIALALALIRAAAEALESERSGGHE